MEIGIGKGIGKAFHHYRWWVANGNGDCERANGNGDCERANDNGDGDIFICVRELNKINIERGHFGKNAEKLMPQIFAY